MCIRILPSLLLLLLFACSSDQQTGPVEIRWDRETCNRCNMAVGDRNFAAQIRGGVANEKNRVYKFDDIGCAVIWLEKQAWKDDSRTEIWVKDHRNGEWIDARKASYVKDKLTPMNYGLGAQLESADAAIDFQQAIAHILASETQRHQHGGHSHMDH